MLITFDKGGIKRQIEFGQPHGPHSGEKIFLDQYTNKHFSRKRGYKISTKLRPRLEKAAIRRWLSLYFFTQLFTSQDEVLTLMNKVCNIIILLMILQVAASFSRIKTSTKVKA